MQRCSPFLSEEEAKDRQLALLPATDSLVGGDYENTSPSGPLNLEPLTKLHPREGAENHFDGMGDLGNLDI